MSKAAKLQATKQPKLTSAQQHDIEMQEVAVQLPRFRKEVAAFKDQVFLNHQAIREYANYEDFNHQQMTTIEAGIVTRDEDNNRMSSIVAQKIKDLGAKLAELKTEIQGVRQSIKDAEDQYAQMTDEVNQVFNEKKEKILEESRQVEAQLNHYAEWQRQSDSFKSHLSELKATIHHNRVLCSEGIAETRQNAQAKIEKHRVRLAEAIRQARAESLRLRSGDISDLSTTFLTQSEAHLQSLNSQLASSEHLSMVNQAIDDENASMLREIERLTRKNQQLKEQEEKQQSVLTKLRAIRKEFQEKEAMQEQSRKRALREREEKKREEEEAARARNLPKPEFHLSEEQEAFITFLNECSTSVRSVLIDILGEEAKVAPAAGSERFEAPKLSSMISEIRELTEKLDEVKPTGVSGKKPVLTPAAAYFAFSAPFDDTDDFIASENWSFAKYEPVKPVAQQGRKPRIIRIRSAKTPL
jgi:hypothetical protein